MTSGNRQPNWDLYEAALLLEAVYNVESGKETKRDAIRRVSSTLREIAKEKGLQIDDTFRNVNGITFQFQSMEYSALGRTSATHKTGSKVFDEVVALYRNNKSEYERILHAVHSMTEKNGGLPNQSDLSKKADQHGEKEDFESWLLSEGKKQDNAKWIIDSFNRVSEYALDKRLIRTALLDITDIKEYNKAINSIQSNKFFRLFKRDLNKFLQTNAKIYASFLKKKDETKRVGTPPTDDEEKSLYVVTDTDKALADKYGEVVCRIYKVLKNNDKHAFLTAQQVSEAVSLDFESTCDILRKASWAEKLSDGYIYGHNNYSKDKTIYFEINHAFGNPSKIETVLIENFRRGFRPGSIMDRNRFVSLYEDKYGETVSLDAIMEIVHRECFKFDDRYFLPKALINSDLAKELSLYLTNYFNQKDNLFHNVLYSAYEHKFESYIYSDRMLAAFLQRVLSGTPLYYFEKYCSTKADAVPDVSAEVKDYLIKMDAPCSYDTIYEQFTHFNRQDVYNALHFNNPEILGNSKVEYFHISAAHITTSEVGEIRSVVSTLLRNSHFITCNEVMEKLGQSNSALMERLNAKFSVLGIRRIFTFYLRSDYDVETGIITYKGQKMSVIDAFADFAKTHSRFTVDDVQKLADYIGVVPYWDTVHTYAVRINPNEFTADQNVEFDTDTIDSAIKYYCTDYITLKEIPDYSRFPSCGTPWNIFLLQQYVYRFSKQFKLLSLGFSKGNASGAIVKKLSEYSDFDSVLIDALEKTKITSPSEAIDYLCNRGFIAERRYKKHVDLLKIAISRRNN